MEVENEEGQSSYEKKMKNKSLPIKVNNFSRLGSEENHKFESPSLFLNLGNK